MAAPRTPPMTPPTIAPISTIHIHRDENKISSSFLPSRSRQGENVLGPLSPPPPPPFNLPAPPATALLET